MLRNIFSFILFFFIVQKLFIHMNKYGRLKDGLIVSLFRIIEGLDAKT